MLFLSTPSLSSTLILCGKIFSFTPENIEEGAPASSPPAPQYLYSLNILNDLSEMKLESTSYPK